MNIQYASTIKVVLDVLFKHIEEACRIVDDDNNPIMEQTFTTNPIYDEPIPRWVLQLRQIHYNIPTADEYYGLNIIVDSNSPYNVTFAAFIFQDNRSKIIHIDHAHVANKDNIWSLYYHMCPLSPGFKNWLDVIIKSGHVKDNSFIVNDMKVKYPEIVVPVIDSSGTRIIYPFSKVTTLQVPPKIGEDDIRKYEKPIPTPDPAQYHKPEDDIPRPIDNLLRCYTNLIDITPIIEDPALTTKYRNYYPTYAINKSEDSNIEIEIINDSTSVEEDIYGFSIVIRPNLISFKIKIGQSVVKISMPPFQKERFKSTFEAFMRYYSEGFLDIGEIYKQTNPGTSI